MLSAGPALVKYQLALTCTPPLLSGQRSLLLDIPRGTLSATGGNYTTSAGAPTPALPQPSRCSATCAAAEQALPLLSKQRAEWAPRAAAW